MDSQEQLTPVMRKVLELTNRGFNVEFKYDSSIHSERLTITKGDYGKACFINAAALHASEMPESLLMLSLEQLERAAGVIDRKIANQTTAAAPKKA